MIEIALCDDDKNDIETLKAFAERFASEHMELPVRITAFTSPEELLKRIEKSGGFDLYILDVLMPNISGIQLAEIIRNKGDHAEIVFLTASSDYAIDAFSVYACGYILKPLCKENFDKTMLHALQKSAREKNETLTVRTKEGLLRIPLHKIVMIESFNHTREITLTDGEKPETTVTLSELFEQLREHSGFFMPHRAYIANLDNFAGIVRYELLMVGNRRIPIPKDRFAAVQGFVRDYFFNRKKL